MPDVSTLLRNFDAVTEEYNKKKLEVTEQLKPQFHDLFKPYLDKHPVIDSLHFTAYTPYFNDGEECIFGVSELDACIVGWDDTDLSFFEYCGLPQQLLIYHATGETPVSSWAKATPEEQGAKWLADNADDINLGIDHAKALVAAQDEGKELSRMLASIPDDVIRDMFGDHIRVEISREGVHVSQYDHE